MVPSDSASGTAHLDLTRRHFDSIAANYLGYKRKNSYYHSYLTKWCRSMVLPGRRVLDIGCGRGELLEEIGCSEAEGIDLSGEMIALARKAFPQHRFHHGAFEDFEPSTSFEAALLINVIDYAYDPCRILKKVSQILSDNGRVVCTAANPLWSGIFRLTSRLGLRIPDSKRLFLTPIDMQNFLVLNGFEIVSQTQALILPKKIPVLSGVLNWIAPRVPFLRSLCSTQLIVARKLPSQRMELSVSIVVPCYNECGNIPRCIRDVPKLGSSTEVIFVDDGSTDATAEAVRSGKREDVEIRLIRYEKNRGKGHAVKTGFENAKGDVVMILDADLTTQPEDLPAVCDALAEGRAEFINCTRMIYPMDNKAMRVANFMGNVLFTRIVSILIETRVTDTLCGTKAFFRKDFAYFQMGNDPWGDYDLLFGAAQLKLAIREVPVHYRDRQAGNSKMKALSHGLKLLKLCIRAVAQIKTMRALKVENPLK